MSVGLWEPNSDKRSGVVVGEEVIDSFLALPKNQYISLQDLEKLGLDPIQIYFTKEDGSWKLNAERTARELYLMMDTMIEEAKKSGAPFDSFVDAVLMGAEMRFPNFDESLIWVPTAK